MRRSERPDIARFVRILGRRGEMPVAGSWDERIAAIAANQRGRIATRQMRAAGVTRHGIASRVGRGALHPLLRGVFAVGHNGRVELGDETAALLGAGDDTALSGLTAAYLWGLLDPRAGDEDVIYIVSPTERRLVSARVQVHRSRILLPTDSRTHRGLPVLSPARTLLDVAEQTTARRTELAFDRGLVAGLVSVSEMMEVAQRASTRPGAPILNGLLHDTPTTVTRSEAEERVLELIRAAELPAPRVNARLQGFEVDFYWPQHGLVLEVDGYRYHSSRTAFERDRRKDATLQAAGLRTMRVTWRQVNGEAFAVVARVALALSRPG